MKDVQAMNVYTYTRVLDLVNNEWNTDSLEILIGKGDWILGNQFEFNANQVLALRKRHGFVLHMPR